MNRNSTWLIVLLTCSLTSCASLFKGTRADITFTGPTDEPVNIISSRDTFKQRQLPTTIQVKKANLQNAITVESDNYRFSRIVPGRKTHWSGFCELGVGHQGILLGGVSYRF
ncbi:MAG: hypothetical protein J5545_10430 [Bacteroidaceae bacterium]|nr:hypothetical protein [Bacteroidaceae bacterium]